MRLLCQVSYKGTNYQGWQKQKDAPTVQETLEKVISKVLNSEINIYGSGRTDSGVHAQRQYFHFDVEKDVDIDKLRYSLNCLLPKDIFINEIKQVSDDFHARYSAKSKTYTYIIRLDKRNPFNYEFETTYPMPVDVNLLMTSLKQFEGTHNFQDFTSKEEDEDNYVRTIYSVEVSYIEQVKQFIVSFKGNGFMRYMVRNMVGTALAIASKKEKEDYITYHLSKKENREIVPYKAPAEGLFLVDVNYSVMPKTTGDIESLQSQYL